METDNERSLKKQVEMYRNEILLQIDRNHKCEEELKQYKDNYNALSQIYRDSTLEYNKIIENLKKENDLLKNELKEAKKRCIVQSPTSPPMTTSQISEDCSIRFESIESCNSDSQDETNYDQNVKIEMVTNNEDRDVENRLEEHINDTQTAEKNDDNDPDVILLSNENESFENGESSHTPSTSDISLFNNLVDASGVFHSCPCCPVKITRKQFIKEHFLKTHVHSKCKGKLVYKCHICNRLFNDLNKLSIHLPSTHDNNDAFKCEKCGALFKLANQLNLHKMKHRRLSKNP